MRILLALTALVLLAFAAAGCGNPPETTAPPPSGPAKGAPIKGGGTAGGGMPAPSVDG